MMYWSIHAKSVNSINGRRITNYVTYSSGYLCDVISLGATPQSIPSFMIFSHHLTDTERKRKTVKDGKKLHGTVDKSSSEQQFDMIAFIV